MTNPFTKAKRKAVEPKIAFTGPSGSGKTYSALLFARGYVGPEGRIALIDTENGAAELYDDVTDFDHTTIESPYTGHKYMELIEIACREGYDALIIDSLSHEWAGMGGVIDVKEGLDVADPKNTWSNWKLAKRHIGHNELIAYILSAPIPIFCTMRSKQAFEVTTDGGKMRVKKAGLAPIQQPDVDYEFMVIFDIDVDTNCASTSSKNRTPLWKDDVATVITEEHGALLREWQEKGAAFVQPLTQRTRAKIQHATKSLDLTVDNWIKFLTPYLIEHKIDPITELADLCEADALGVYDYLCLKYKEKQGEPNE